MVDLVIACSPEKTISKIKQNEFEMVDKRKSNFCLGIQVELAADKGEFSIYQKLYTDQIVKAV